MRSINDITPKEWDEMGRPRKEKESVLQAEYDAHEAKRLEDMRQRVEENNSLFYTKEQIEINKMVAMMTDNPLDKQVGGQHYASMKIQPVEFITANNLGFLEGNVVKYICRHGSKNGAEDIKKAIHYCELLLQTKYGG